MTKLTQAPTYFGFWKQELLNVNIESHHTYFAFMLFISLHNIHLIENWVTWMTVYLSDLLPPLTIVLYLPLSQRSINNLMFLEN